MNSKLFKINNSLTDGVFPPQSFAWSVLGNTILFGGQTSRCRCHFFKNLPPISWDKGSGRQDLHYKTGLGSEYLNSKLHMASLPLDIHKGIGQHDLRSIGFCLSVVSIFVPGIFDHT